MTPKELFNRLKKWFDPKKTYNIHVSKTLFQVKEVKDVEVEKTPAWAKELIADVKDIKQRLDVIEKDIQAMKNTPTMKRELGLE